MSVFHREEFRKICTGEVKVDGLIIMRDVAIAKSEFVKDEKSVTKIQHFQNNNVLFSYCSHPEVSHSST